MTCSYLAGRLGIGSRRNFIIRMRCGKFDEDLDDADSRLNEIKNRCKEKRKAYDGEEYAFVHCTGYVPVNWHSLYVAGNYLLIISYILLV